MCLASLQVDIMLGLPFLRIFLRFSYLAVSIIHWTLVSHLGLHSFHIWTGLWLIASLVPLDPDLGLPPCTPTDWDWITCFAHNLFDILVNVSQLLGVTYVYFFIRCFQVCRNKYIFNNCFFNIWCLDCFWDIKTHVSVQTWIYRR